MDKFDLIVVGAGHAGCEAALAAARLGKRTLLVTLSRAHVAEMPCNPAIGGLAKGQLVREVDALGGEMGLAIDAAGIQFRMLNTSKGPAVRAPRAQADRALYKRYWRRLLDRQPRLTLREDLVEAIVVSRGRAAGVACRSGWRAGAGAVVVTTGTFLNGLMHVGAKMRPGGRLGEPAATGLSRCLAKLGFALGRLKTGTSPRIARDSVNLKRLKAQRGDRRPPAFSFLTEKLKRPDVPCWLTATTPASHALLRSVLDSAPLFTGQIKGTGPRYCPSVELKVVRFPERERHQVILEPEGLRSPRLYLNGLATSIPAEAQRRLLATIPGLEKARILRYGYAIEYDLVWPTQLQPSLETKKVRGLFLAGQVNGTSGYEEAAGQGLLAGINACRFLDKAPAFVPGRAQAYLGVMVDDLTTKGVDEPYRMFTSRAEYRLNLRQDNADRRLTPAGLALGLAGPERARALARLEEEIAAFHRHLEGNRWQGKSLARWLARPEVDLAELERRVPALKRFPAGARAREQAAIELSYGGYLERERQEAARLAAGAGQKIPAGFDYALLAAMKREARERLARARPRDLGQAASLPGITPADLSVLRLALR